MSNLTRRSVGRLAAALAGAAIGRARAEEVLTIGMDVSNRPITR
jgi:hypothetical protein